LELSGRRRCDARPRGARYTTARSRAWRHAVGAPLERRVSGGVRRWPRRAPPVAPRRSKAPGCGCWWTKRLFSVQAGRSKAGPSKWMGVGLVAKPAGSCKPWLYIDRGEATWPSRVDASTVFNPRRLTFELSGRRRQDARPPRCRINHGAARAWWPAVGAPLERRVRQRRADGSCGVASLQLRLVNALWRGLRSLQECADGEAPGL